MSEKTEDRKCDADFKVSAPDVTQDKDKVDFTKGSVDEFKYYPDNPTSNFHKAKFAAKGPSRYYDPCQESANMSIKCWSRTTMTGRCVMNTSRRIESVRRNG